MCFNIFFPKNAIKKWIVGLANNKNSGLPLNLFMMELKSKKYKTSYSNDIKSLFPVIATESETISRSY